MPFTPSHPAAVLPLLRTGLPASALVVGSLAPDVPYYVPLRIGGFHPPVSLGGPTHTAWALATLDLAVGALTWVLWHAVLAAPVMAWTPVAVRARLAGRVRPGLRHRLATGRDRALVAVALVVGAATHVLWDEFTHVDRWGTAHVPALAATFAGLEGYRWAQYGSGVVGGLVLLAWAVGWWRRTEPVACEPSPGRWYVVPAAMAACGAVAGLWAALAADGVRAAMFYGATRGGAAAAGVAVVVAVAVRLRGRALPDRAL